MPLLLGACCPAHGPHPVYSIVHGGVHGANIVQRLQDRGVERRNLSPSAELNVESFRLSGISHAHTITTTADGATHAVVTAVASYEYS
jgi:hypothetical protein